MTKSEIARNLASVVYVLGASDPEMVAIENGIRNIHRYYDVAPYILYAALVGNDGVLGRVHGGNAYMATTCLDTEGNEVHPMSVDGLCGYGSDVHFEDMDGFEPVWVECAVAGGTRIHATVCDHHREGDPGYGKAPAQYWEASSIGQIWRFFTHQQWVPEEIANDMFGADRFMVAASDHCPGHAFAGQCPGIDVATLRAFRAANSAAFNKLEPAEWLAKVDASIAKLKAMPRAVLADTEYVISTENIELGNHAQLMSGLPMEYTMLGTDRDPRIKVGLLGGLEPTFVQAWMDSKRGELVDIYGDPSRGYAGGYLPRPMTEAELTEARARAARIAAQRA